MAKPKQIGVISIPIFEYVEGEPNPPAMKGDGIAVWGARSKDGKTDYLSIKVLGSISCAAFTPKEK